MRSSSGFFWSVALGVALGGFFDGILLHQILQWHHLLSLVPEVTDLRMQVLWDGYFHALMYVIAIVAIWQLWRGFARHGHGPRPGAIIIGFGLWHILDAVLSHWILGIHRINIDSPNPLAWDIAWLVIFGIVPLVLGWRLTLRIWPATTPLSLILLTAVAGGAGAWALVPPPDQNYTTVVFSPDMSPTDVMIALTSVDAGLVWSDAEMGVVVANVPQGRQWSLYGKGALLVSGAGSPAGCITWSTV